MPGVSSNKHDITLDSHDAHSSACGISKGIPKKHIFAVRATVLALGTKVTKTLRKIVTGLCFAIRLKPLQKRFPLQEAERAESRAASSTSASCAGAIVLVACAPK